MGGSPFRLYYLTRNRYVYVARYGRWWEKVLFGLLFSNLFIGYYAFSMLAVRRADLDAIRFHLLDEAVTAGAEWSYRPLAIGEGGASGAAGARPCWFQASFAGPSS